MPSLKERLAAQFPNGGDGEYADLYDVNPDGAEALARIEALEGALLEIVALDPGPRRSAARAMANIARSALGTSLHHA